MNIIKNINMNNKKISEVKKSNTSYGSEKIYYGVVGYGNGSSCSSSTVSYAEEVELEVKTDKLEKRLKGLKKGSVEYRNTILDYRIEKAGGLNSREAVVAAARYLSEEENIPYYWGAKRNEYGVDGDWGKDRQLNYEGTEMQPQGGSYPYGLDCSGFVSWAITNGGYNMPCTYTESYSEFATDYNFSTKNLKSGKIKAGDLLYKEGHISIITDLNLEKGTIKVAEEKGAEYGMVVTEMKIDDFVNSTDYTSVYSLEEYYNNKDNYIDIK